MPLFIPVVFIASALLAIGGIAYGCDQADKREEELKRERAEIGKLKNRISELEQEHAHLLPALGKKNRQVRALADEICRLRGELEDARRGVH